jgi:Mn2+/Fe2+ NRAMP family transporter
VKSGNPPLLSIIAPGILVAATGVGAGDLLTASIAGSKAGLAILWAAPIGCLMKWTLNEGIARWQMATDTTLLEGWVTKLGRWIQWVFLVYFVMWSFFVGGALINACGVAAANIWPVGDPNTSKIFWGIVHSFLGLGLVWAGGFRLFEKIMSGFIAFKFAAVIITAVLIAKDWGAVARGLTIPTIPNGALPWMLGVLGGVGGTVTLMSYGYWIRERQRSGEEGMRLCRLDLAVAYIVTALFGVAMIIIGSQIKLEGSGIRLASQLAEQLAMVLGTFGRWAFLLGFWGAVFSALMGVWQSAPYLFADFLALRRGDSPPDLKKTGAYRGYLIAISIVPLVSLLGTVEKIQLAYAVMGALFMPLLAITLLILNNQTRLVGERFRSAWWINVVLIVTIVSFIYMGVRQLQGTMPSFGG